jgi:hypothetical protein
VDSIPDGCSLKGLMSVTIKSETYITNQSKLKIEHKPSFMPTNDTNEPKSEVLKENIHSLYQSLIVVYFSAPKFIFIISFSLFLLQECPMKDEKAVPCPKRRWQSFRSLYFSLIPH